ncbi:hypothetical protein TWF225_008355 [Orbilia oligospora]|nr:hypothetical protein TWF225_008355 [Orbilia oligospora]KAF3254801.1 hypothetical protein TWF128_006111 [Orbilia oligospora]KAF3254802.1 hypothetical protein TWF128_006111 [Orbilia oligospora]KAF3269796.1 hypothetical protein TWF217_008160 [Orbilia oligospora]KAF3278391.1 hypothetical protein TWF132_001174 [Orbilia oligospora]
MPLTPTMPPTRNSTLRTERTHEENQERAYIAASHRTDRSLEARMESARRASEIHKQRTGKFFKITEKAVLAGEVYMDDDDEIPAPYYQLDQQLKPDAPNREEFFKRFVDYITVNVGLRRRLESAIGEAKVQSAGNGEPAAAHKRGPASASSGLQEGSALEQGQGPSTGIRIPSFSSTVFIPPYQGQLQSTTPEPSNSPSPPAMVTHTHPQVATAQFQPPISANGTQFHMGPVGLGTLPPHYFEGTYLGRRQTVPAIRIPQQISPPSASVPVSGLSQNPYYSAVLTPEQYQVLSQNFSTGRSSGSAAEAVRSPMSDISMASFRPPLNPTTPSVGSGSPECLLVRRPSAPGRISDSPLRTSIFSPHLKQQQKLSTNSENFNMNTNLSIRRQTPNITTQDLKSPITSVTPTSREGTKSIPPSPATKRKATDISGEERPIKSSRSDDSPTRTSYSPVQNQAAQNPILDTDFGLFDFSLPQNYKDILYGPGMFMPGDAALSFAGLTARDFNCAGISTTCPTETSGISLPVYDISDSESGHNNATQNQSLPINPPLTFNMSFSKHNNDSFENFEEMWRKYFLERGVQPHTENTGYPAGQHGIDPGGSFPS